MKCARVLPLLLIAAALAACGGGNSQSSTAKTSKIKTRALVSNSLVTGTTGALEIVNFATDQLTTFQMGCCAAYRQMAVASDKSRTYAVNSSAPGIAVFDNATEQLSAQHIMSGVPDAFVVTSDNKFIFAAIRNSTAASSTPGSVDFVDTTASTPTVSRVAVPLVRNLAMTHNSTKLLAFGDQSDSVFIIDVATQAVTEIPGFSRPVSAVFEADDLRAYVVNCGAQCGGTGAPGIAVLEMAAPAAPTVVVPLPAARTALLDGNTLYVAGTSASGGVLSVLTANGAAVTVNGTPAAIGDGVHTAMAIAGGKLFIGARTCSAGCLTIVDVASKGAVVDSPKGDVTGMDPVPNRNVVYVVEGGELRLYDATTSAELQGHSIDVFGRAEDVKVID